MSDGKLLCELETADAKDLYATGWQHAERFVAKDRDGKFDIHGIIADRAILIEEKYPVVEVIYAGPHDAFVPKGWRSRYGQWRDELMELGFITVQIDGKGTAIAGASFSILPTRTSTTPASQIALSGCRRAKKYPYMDINRVGIYGGSAARQMQWRPCCGTASFTRPPHRLRLSR